MSRPSASSAPTLVRPRSERTVLLTLAAVQFTHVLDFMIMMPLGPRLMAEFSLSPTEFSRLVAAYGGAAAVAGLAGATFLDRFDRRRALSVLYCGFALATLACALAPGHPQLLLARLAAGACGGLAGSVVVAMVADVVPAERRGRGMAYVMSAFPLASIAGVPLGILLANSLGWHAPFFLLVALALPTLLAITRILPGNSPAADRPRIHPFAQFRALLAEPLHWRAFAVTGFLVCAGGLLVPFMAPSLVANVGVTEKVLPMVYFFGGAATFLSTPFIGRLTDRHDKLHVLAALTLPALAAALLVTHLGPAPLPAVLLVTTLFFIGISGRFGPATTLVANAIDPRFRGGFMSLNSAVQQGALAGANLVGGALITRGADGRLLGYGRVGWIAAGALLVTLFLALRLRAAAPHAARNAAPLPPVVSS
jgi:predicted MFS family arabinose efflux permease